MSKLNQIGTKRRDFLKTTAVSGLGLLFSQTLTPQIAFGVERIRKERIIVVGAGIAGLTAAKHLSGLGFDVTVLEARQRIGGRIWTANLQDQPIDLGAQWIVSVVDNPIAKFCQEQNFKKVANDEDSVRVYESNGTAFGDDEAERLYAQAQKLIDQTRTLNQQRIAARQPDITMADAIRMVEKNPQPTPREQRYGNWVIASEVETSESESVDRVSLRNYWAEDEEESFENSHFFLPGGFSQITTMLAQGLDICLGQPVTKVHWASDGVEVVTDQETFRADRAIITLPLGVLKAGMVQFTPELPAKKLQAVQSLGFGAIHKIALRFDKKFWKDDEQLLGYASDMPGKFIEWWNYARLAGSTILSLWSHGDAARKLEDQGPQVAIDEAMKSLRAVFKSTIPEPVDSQATSWITDPYSRGAHVYLPVGTSYDQLDALAVPLGNRLYFAGEATSRRHLGTAHGAWFSGLREAERIAKAK